MLYVIFSNPNNKEYFSIWNKILPTTKKEVEVNGIRSEFNIANGLSYTHQEFGIREGIGIAGDKKDTEFYQRFLLDKTSVRETLSLLRKLNDVK